MKRYRVWAGNRKIFLFPENWLEPEFRDDKTHLFTEMEGALLQGDVSNDLVEDAFFNYLKKLDELARLDIVAMYLRGQPLDPASNHLARHWPDLSPAAQVFLSPLRPPDVDALGTDDASRSRAITSCPWCGATAERVLGDIYRQSGSSAIPSDENALISATVATSRIETGIGSGAILNIGSGSANSSGKKITELSLGQLAGGLRSAVNRKLVKVQLHWSEYFQGEWSVRESGGFSASLIKSVSLDFDSSKVFIHATKDFEDGEERGVKIHLGGEINQAFQVVSRNSRPTRANRGAAPRNPYNASEVQANRYGATARSRSLSLNASKPKWAREPKRHWLHLTSCDRAASLRCYLVPTTSLSELMRSRHW